MTSNSFKIEEVVGHSKDYKLISSEEDEPNILVLWLMMSKIDSEQKKVYHLTHIKILMVVATKKFVPVALPNYSIEIEEEYFGKFKNMATHFMLEMMSIHFYKKVSETEYINNLVTIDMSKVDQIRAEHTSTEFRSFSARKLKLLTPISNIERKKYLLSAMPKTGVQNMFHSNLVFLDVGTSTPLYSFTLIYEA